MNGEQILEAIGSRPWAACVLYESNTGCSCAIGSVLLECGVPSLALEGKSGSIPTSVLRSSEFKSLQYLFHLIPLENLGMDLGTEYESVRPADVVSIVTGYGDFFFWRSVMHTNDDSKTKEEAMNRIKLLIDEYENTKE